MAMLNDLRIMLGSMTYPGRGIALGVTPDGEKSVAVYFIMGRSSNSRNRIFVPEEDGISTKAWDESLLTDPSLIIYHPVREIDMRLVVTNGDQTDTVSAFLMAGESFEDALRTRDFEPDAPHFTPRISGLLEANGSHRLSVIKAADQAGTASEREFFEYPPIPGEGHFIHTYMGDGDPLPSFEGEPYRIMIADDPVVWAREIWESLDSENKVALFVRYTDMWEGTSTQIIINAHEEER